MKRVINSLSRGILVLLILGGILIFTNAQMVITSFKSENDFEDLLEKEAEEGMHIKGEVLYAYDCYAYEETWKENKNGTRTPAKTSHYYYAIPGKDGILGLEVFVDDKEEMEALANETYEYMYGGEEPSTKVMAEGRLSKMNDEMSGLFKEYLTEMGYTADEIAEMGDFYYIEQPDAIEVQQIMFFGGIVFVLLSVLIFVIKFKKNAPEKQVETEAGFGTEQETNQDE